MKHRNVSLREANQNFSRLIAAVEQGEAFSITRRGQEVAHLLPVSRGKAAATGDLSTVLNDAIAPESSLGERVLRLEARLDRLSPLPGNPTNKP
jgi:prevent-host-death family protein